MRPYYEAWRVSTHNDVSCVMCHYEPGLKAQLKGELAGISQLVQYVTRTFSPKPKAEISDEARLLAGQVTFKNNIIFDHADHLGEESHSEGAVRYEGLHRMSHAAREEAEERVLMPIGGGLSQ